jgi:hypothetical protein
VGRSFPFDSGLRDPVDLRLRLAWPGQWLADSRALLSRIRSPAWCSIEWPGIRNRFGPRAPCHRACGGGDGLIPVDSLGVSCFPPCSLYSLGSGKRAASMQVSMGNVVHHRNRVANLDRDLEKGLCGYSAVCFREHPSHWMIRRAVRSQARACARTRGVRPRAETRGGTASPHRRNVQSTVSRRVTRLRSGPAEASTLAGR